MHLIKHGSFFIVSYKGWISLNFWNVYWILNTYISRTETTNVWPELPQKQILTTPSFHQIEWIHPTRWINVADYTFHSPSFFFYVFSALLFLDIARYSGWLRNNSFASLWLYTVLVSFIERILSFTVICFSTLFYGQNYNRNN